MIRKKYSSVCHEKKDKRKEEIMHRNEIATIYSLSRAFISTKHDENGGVYKYNSTKNETFGRAK